MSAAEATITIHGVKWSIRADAQGEEHVAESQGLSAKTRTKWLRFLESRLAGALADPVVERAITEALRKSK